MEKNNLEKQVAELMDDAIISRRLKENEQHEAYLKDIDATIGPRRNPVSKGPYTNWQRYALIAAVIGTVVIAAIGLWPKPPAPPVRPLVKKDLVEVVDKYMAESLERTVMAGTTKVIDVKSLYNDSNDPQAFDKIIAQLEPKGSKRTLEETYYLAKSYAQKQQYDKAAELLKTFDFDKYENGSDVQWFYALTLLKLARKAEARLVLENLKSSPLSTNVQKDQSAVLLTDLSAQ